MLDLIRVSVDQVSANADASGETGFYACTCLLSTFQPFSVILVSNEKLWGMA